jgi:hypothetical protein
MRFALVYFLGLTFCFCQSYPPAAGETGSTAISKDSPGFVAWATGIAVARGHVDISNPNFSASGSVFASSGQPEYALGYPDGNTVSLGDAGSAILTFAQPIIDGNGFDFAVFENGSAAFLELAFVEVSSDGVHFFRFPNHSQTQTATQIGPFGSPAAPYLNNLAGKYAAAYGTPFDLSELADDAFLDKNHITHVKVIDVVGSINPDFASYDSFGNAVNDSFPTPFNSSGFDLQAVGVIHQETLVVRDIDGERVGIFPNPATDILYVNGVSNGNALIFDVSGKLLMEFRINGIAQIDVARLEAGAYFIEIRAAEKTTRLKFIKR